MRNIGLANKRIILITLILISCIVGVSIETRNTIRLSQNEEVNASLKMNQLYSFFLPKKQKLQSFLSGNRKIGFYTDALIPQDKEVALFAFTYLLAPIIVDKDYRDNNTIFMVYFFNETSDWLRNQKRFSIAFQEDYGFCKLAILKRNK